jgi:hypothetical protein
MPLFKEYHFKIALSDFFIRFKKNCRKCEQENLKLKKVNTMQEVNAQTNS